MNTAMFLQTLLEVQKFDSKFKAKKNALLPILRRAKVNNLPQWEFVKGGRSGQRYENIELRIPVPFLDEANTVFDDLKNLVEYVYEESDDYGLGGVLIRPRILSPDEVEYKEHDVVFTEIRETIIQGIRDAKYIIMKLMEKWGSGIPRVVREVCDEGLAVPVFEGGEVDLVVNIYRKEIDSDSSQYVPDSSESKVEVPGMYWNGTCRPEQIFPNLT